LEIGLFMSDDNTLIERWKAGDQYAAETLYNLHKNRLFRLAYGLLGNAADAEEVAQDTLTYALTHIDRYNPERAAFNTWLHIITVSRCRDRQRGRRLPQFSLTAWLTGGNTTTDPAPGQEQRAEEAETCGEVLHAVQSLPAPLREAIILRYWAGHTYREMAQILDCPLPTTQSRVRLAYQKLRAALAPAIYPGAKNLSEEAPE
jgi:RNA polymerase sigma-70 factor (ECF subfamily)